MSDRSSNWLSNPLTADADPARPLPLDWQTYYDSARSAWFELLSHDPEESEVQHFLELHPAMIPGGSGDVGPGGHHGSDLQAVFSRPRLEGKGRTFEPDFMWVTRSSGLLTPILIEIEKPTKRWFRGDGRPTSQFTEAHDQLNDWRSWFAKDGNSTIFRDRYQLLGDRFPDRPLKPQFVLIYGRLSEFQLGGGHTNVDSLPSKREGLRHPDEFFYTFDSLEPSFKQQLSFTTKMTALGPVAHAFSPTYGTGPDLVEGARLIDGVADALDRTVLMSDERKEYLKARWLHWSKVAEDRERAGDRVRVRQLGTE
jgi:hypothetical protein